MADDQTRRASSLIDLFSRPARLRLVHLLAAAVVITAIGLVVWMIQAGRNSSIREATRIQFGTVAISLMNYSEYRGRLPCPVVKEGFALSTTTSPPQRTDQPLYSWRVEIVPYLEAWHGGWDPSQPWDHPLNRHLVELSSFYTYKFSELKTKSPLFPDTNILAITGPGTAFGDGSEPPMVLKQVPPYTILAVETRSSGLQWPAPGDFDVRTMPRTINAPDGKGISGESSGGFHLIFADGQFWFMSDKVPFGTLEKFFTVAGAGKYDREKLLGPFALHRGP